jgi:hypothetical protein
MEKPMVQKTPMEPIQQILVHTPQLQRQQVQLMQLGQHWIVIMMG